MAIIELNKLSKNFGGLRALDDVNLEVDSLEIRGLIGPNGAGKSTLLNTMSGYYKPTSGRIMFQGEDITGLTADQVAAKGLARTFQKNTLFRDMTVIDNVILGFHLSFKIGFVRTLFNASSTRIEEKENRNKAIEILDLLNLTPLKFELAKNLPHGHQRLLGVAMALALNPRILLMDEPVTGMNPEEASIMAKDVKRIRDELKMTIILVEHNIRVVMGVCDKITVLNYGRKIAEGSPDEITHNPDVIKAYLGDDVVGGITDAG